MPPSSGFIAPPSITGYLSDLSSPTYITAIAELKSLIHDQARVLIHQNSYDCAEIEVITYTTSVPEQPRSIVLVRRVFAAIVISKDSFPYTIPTVRAQGWEGNRIALRSRPKSTILEALTDLHASIMELLGWFFSKDP